MPQIHVKLPEKTHKAIKLKAKEFNCSVQEYVERTLESNVFREQLSLFPDKTNNKEKNGKPPLFTFIDLFAGIGGIRLAFEKQGGECKFSSEWDRWCQKTYYENFGEIPYGDITKIPPEDIPSHDILTAGFPCQPFSIAGVSKKKSLGREHGFLDKAQGTLFFNTAEIIRCKRPKMFLLENVKNLRSHDKGNTFNVIKGVIDELEYHYFEQVIDAKPYVPQHRERLFIIGFDKKVFKEAPNYKFPKPPKSEPKLGSILENKVDKKYILSNKLWSYLQKYAEKHKKKGNGFGYGLFGKGDTARTLSARYYKDGSEVLIKVPRSNPRRLTPKECSRLQGFPENFKIPVSDTQAYKQFGNSVATPVVEAVAKQILKVYKSHLKTSKS
jgi:DNA (cytosine-5)-methyltransferase 1